MMKVMICGVHCRRGDAHCNGYCEGLSKEPPAATEAQQLQWARQQANEALKKATHAWQEYAVLSKSDKAVDILAKLRNIDREAS